MAPEHEYLPLPRPNAADHLICLPNEPSYCCNGLIARYVEPFTTGAMCLKHIQTLMDTVFEVATPRKYSNYPDAKCMTALERSSSFFNVAGPTDLNHVVAVTIFHHVQIVRYLAFGWYM